MDCSIRVAATDLKQRHAIAQYISRAPLSKQNLTLFTAGEFIAELTQHLPPQGMQLIRRYGLYSSRGRGVWHSKAYLAPLAPTGGEPSRERSPQSTQASEQGALSSAETRASWARLIVKVYEVDLLVCPACGSAMKVLAVITDACEVKKILMHLVTIGKPPPGLDPACLN